MRRKETQFKVKWRGNCDILRFMLILCKHQRGGWGRSDSVEAGEAEKDVNILKQDQIINILISKIKIEYYIRPQFLDFIKIKLILE